MGSNSKENNFLNNCFNYFGGKGKLLPQILPLIPEKINNYIEVFSGGFTVGLNLKANKYYYNDKSIQMADMVSTFKNSDTQQVLSWIDYYIAKYELIKGTLPKEDKLILKDKNCPKELKEQYQVRMGVPGYKLLRDRYNSIKVRTPEKDIILYTLLCFSFNNQLGFNGDGDYNIPKGNGRSDFNPTLRNKLEVFSNYIKKIDLQISSEDFNKFKSFTFEKNDFVYLDPPYIITDSAYNRSPETRWDMKKEEELLEFLDYLDDNEVNFMLSNVVEHKGRVNEQLLDWSSKYMMYELSKDYNNCNYQVKKDEGITREVVVINYMPTENKESKIISMPSKSINQDCIGSNFDDFLKEEGILEEVEAKAKETVATYVNKRNNYEDSFKKEMVERYNNGESAKSLREKYGFSQKSLCYWTKLFQYATAEEFVENGEDPYSDVEQEEADNLALSIIEEFSKPMEPIKINQEVFMRLYDKHSTIDLNDLNNLQVTKTVEASRSFGKVSGGCVYYVILDEKREELIRNADLEGVQAYFTVLTRITHKDKPIKLTLESVVVTETREVIRELNPGV